MGVEWCKTVPYGMMTAEVTKRLSLRNAERCKTVPYGMMTAEVTKRKSLRDVERYKTVPYERMAVQAGLKNGIAKGHFARTPKDPLRCSG